jgi:hypothetical protein
MILASAILPSWLVLPMAAVVLLVLAAHVNSLQTPEVPSSRRRIRSASGVLMMFVTALLAYAFGIVSPRVNPRMFVIAWTSISALLMMVVMLAGLDMVNTLRLHREAKRDLRQHLRDVREHADGLRFAGGDDDEG